MLVFAGLYLVGNPVDVLLSPTATPAERLQVIQSFGLDKPVWDQYLLFLKRALSGDLGNSFIYNQPALTLILRRMPATLELAFVALVMALFIGIPLGIYAGLRPKGLISKSIMTFSISASSHLALGSSSSNAAAPV
ncbi:ABC transporter permease [Martelella sp. FLE1502]